MKKVLENLESENVEKRLLALEELINRIDDFDKDAVIKALKPHILDWDETVRQKVSKVLKLYTGI